MEDPRIRMLLQLRSDLEKELDEIHKRAELLEEYIEALDMSIGAGSFATADTALGKLPETEPAIDTVPVELTGEERSITVRAKDKDIELAVIEVKGDQLRIIPSSHAVYDIKRGAFARFFVERILGSFQQEDRVNVENGLMEWEEAFDFEVVAEDSILKELVIKNYGDQTRLAEIERTLRWALDKIYQAK